MAKSTKVNPKECLWKYAFQYNPFINLYEGVLREYDNQLRTDRDGIAQHIISAKTFPQLEKAIIKREKLLS